MRHYHNPKGKQSKRTTENKKEQTNITPQKNITPQSRKHIEENIWGKLEYVKQETKNGNA